MGAGTGYASMRPRVFPAEDATDGWTADRPNVASMRPRVFPAEDNNYRKIIII